MFSTISSQTDYYAIAGHLIGSTNGTATTYDLTDAEGSVLTSLSSSAVLGEQIYGPYGNQRYTQGTMGTDKGYTGQFQDAATGLDYYNARYYDPVMGQFLSADNAQGFDPYSYVNGNPETTTDPTGQRACVLQDDGHQTCGGDVETPIRTPQENCSTGFRVRTLLFERGTASKRMYQGPHGPEKTKRLTHAQERNGRLCSETNCLSEKTSHPRRQETFYIGVFRYGMPGHLSVCIFAKRRLCSFWMVIFYSKGNCAYYTNYWFYMVDLRYDET